MIRSFRLEPELEARLEQAAQVEGVPISRFIRDSVSARCTQVLNRTLKEELADVIGVVALPAGAPPVNVAERTGEAFAELLRARQ